jgi:hypothetical protein
MRGTIKWVSADLEKAEQLKAEMAKENKSPGEVAQELNHSSLSEMPEITIDSISRENADDVAKPLITTIRFTDTLNRTGNIYFINPELVLNHPKRIFTDSLRLTDIDFGCNQLYGFSMHIMVPPNFSIEGLPANKVMISEDSSMMFTREFQVSGRDLLILNSFKLNKSMFRKEEYPMLKRFFDKMNALVGEQVILRGRDGKRS